MHLPAKTFRLTLVSFLLLGLSSCKKGSTITTKVLSNLTGSETTIQAGALQLTLGEQMAEDIALTLKKSAGLTSTQAKAIKTGALAGLAVSSSDEGSSLQLTQGVDPNNLELAAPIIMEGAIKAMSSPEAGLSGDDVKVGIAGAITGAVFKSLSNKISKVSGDAKKNLAGNITKAALSSLDEGGVSSTAISKGIGQVMEKTVSNLDNAGYSADELGPVFATVTSKGMEGIKDAGIDSKGAGAALNVFLEKSVGALDEAGVASTTMGSFIGPMMTTAVGSLDNFGLKPSQVGNVVDDLMQGAVGALDDAGFSSAGDVKGVMNECIKGAMGGMADAGVTPEYFADTMESMMSGAIGSLDDIGIKDLASIQDVSGEMINQAVGFVDDFGITDPTIIQKASLKLAEGTMTALGEFKNQGLISGNDAKNLAATVQKKGVSALKEQNDRFGFSDANGSGLAALFSEGIRQGLAEAKFTATEITGMANDIAQAGLEGLIEAAVPPEVAESAKNLAETSINAWVNEMEIHCKEDKGVWRTDNGGWCEFPLAAPIDGAIGPNPTEEEGCFNIGGFIMFTPDGNWFCDSFGTLAVSGEADCLAQGFWWVPDGQGGYFCETLASAGNLAASNPCYDNTGTQALCQVKAGCIWLGSFCEESSQISCGSAFTQDACSKTPGCLWNSGAGFCENSTIVKCEGTTSSTCSTQPGCIWDNGCKPAALIECHAQTTETNCTQTPGCGWDGAYCLNLQSISCDVNVDEASCQSKTGCIWDPQANFCFNSSGLSCDLNTTNATCSTEPGCLWSGDACINAASLDCKSSSTSATCGTVPGCIWDAGQNFCLNASTVSCSAQLTNTTCQGTPGCLWDTVGNFCINSANISCEGLGESICLAEPGCLWDSNQRFCVNSSFVDCRSNTTSTTCNTAPGCSWDNAHSYCLAAANLDCGSHLTSPTCSDASGCFWDNANNFCANSNSIDCNTRGSATCETDDACFWDAANASCQQFTHDPCQGYLTQTTCPADLNCAWDAGKQECHYEGQTCYERFNSFSCESDPVCNWQPDGNGGGSCHEDGAAYCSLTYGDQATCDQNPYCQWDGATCTYAGTPNCYAHTDITSCTTDPIDTYNICYWASGYCKSDDSQLCSNYFSIPGDENACNAEPYCEVQGNSCVYTGPTACEKITGQSACDSDTDCFWDSTYNSCGVKSSSQCSYLDQNSCYTSGANCSWNGTTCEYSGPVDCKQFTDMNTCNTTPSNVCTWDTNSSNCYENGSAFCSASFTDEQSCNNWGSCIWNNNTCNYLGQISCESMDGNQTMCEGQTGCYFTSYDNKCHSNGYEQCSILDNDSAACDSQSECYHDGTVCNYQGIEICGIINNQSTCDADYECRWETDSGGYCTWDMAMICPMQYTQQDCNMFSNACDWDTSTCTFRDYNGPHITDISFGQSSYNSGDSISITVTASDDSGIDISSPYATACWKVESFSNPGTPFFPCNSLTNNGDGTYTTSFTTNPYTKTGIYQITSLKLKDMSNNQNESSISLSSSSDTSYSGYGHSVMTIPQITINNTSPVDSTAPTPASAISMSCSSADARTKPMCYINFTVTDSGGAGINTYVDNYWTIQSTTGNHFFSVKGPLNDLGSNNYQLSFQLSQYVEIGTYRLTWWEIKDNAGNSNIATWTSGTYYSGLHNHLLLATFSVTNANTDINAPVLNSIGFEFSSYSPNDNGKLLLNVTDAGSPATGVSQFNPCYNVEQTGGGFSFSICTNFNNVSGDNYEYSFTVPSGAPSGVYYLKEVKFYDQAGNYRYYQAPDNSGTGVYTIDGGTPLDTPPPAPNVQTISISP